MPSRKRKSSKAWWKKLIPLELPTRKWDHVAIDFVVGMPVQDDCDTILTVVDKATKMCHFIACTEKISAKEVAQLYWKNVGCGKWRDWVARNSHVTGRSAVCSTVRWLDTNWEIMDTMNGNACDYICV